ncbi:MAG TPA: hypothetical protein VM910_12230 [Bradyrhizobium sp.]|nr:hypothetical protein [Bradyrhizobium sp.]
MSAASAKPELKPTTKAAANIFFTTQPELVSGISLTKIGRNA